MKNLFSDQVTSISSGATGYPNIWISLCKCRLFLIACAPVSFSRLKGVNRRRLAMNNRSPSWNKYMFSPLGSESNISRQIHLENWDRVTRITRYMKHFISFSTPIFPIHLWERLPCCFLHLPDKMLNQWYLDYYLVKRNFFALPQKYDLNNLIMESK